MSATWRFTMKKCVTCWLQETPMLVLEFESTPVKVHMFLTSHIIWSPVTNEFLSSWKKATRQGVQHPPI